MCVCGAYSNLWSPEDPMELDLQVTVSPLMWVLGIELRSSAKATLTYKHEPIYPALHLGLLYIHTLYYTTKKLKRLV